MMMQTITSVAAHMPGAVAAAGTFSCLPTHRAFFSILQQAARYSHVPHKPVTTAVSSTCIHSLTSRLHAPAAVVAAAVLQVHQIHYSSRTGSKGWGGCVDLNPGFAFRPGTPKRTAAVLRHVGQQSVLPGDTHTAAPTVASMQAAVLPAAVQAVPEAVVPWLGFLTHREQLQVGIQELNAAFYAKVRQQQWQQHQQKIRQLGAQADVIPCSWFAA